MPREIVVDWTTTNGPGKVSVFNFIEASSVADQREDLETFLGSISGALDSGTSWVIRTSGREWDTSTGGLSGAWTDSAVRDGVGSVGGEPLPDAIQILFKWNTGHIVSGRFLSGRTFIPGCARVNDVDGNLEETLAAALEGNANTLAGAGSQLAVWHRPVSGSGGVAWAVDSATVWREFAVLRKRRY